MAATTGPFHDSAPVMSTVDVRPSAVLLLMELLVLSDFQSARRRLLSAV